MEQDTLYLSFSEIPDASEILFKGEIPGIFVEEAIRSHSFPWSHAIFMKAWNYISHRRGTFLFRRTGYLSFAGTYGYPGRPEPDP